MAAQDFEDTVLKALSELTEGQKALRGDVQSLQEGQKALRGDVQSLQEGQKALRGDVRRLEVLHEATDEKMDNVIEGFSPEMVKNNEQSARLDDHEERISKLELAS